MDEAARQEEAAIALDATGHGQHRRRVGMVVVVTDQDGGHGHPYAVGSNAGQVIGLASCSWPWKVKYRKWDIWNDAAAGQGIEDVSY